MHSKNEETDQSKISDEGTKKNENSYVYFVFLFIYKFFVVRYRSKRLFHCVSRVALLFKNKNCCINRSHGVWNHHVLPPHKSFRNMCCNQLTICKNIKLVEMGKFTDNDKQFIILYELLLTLSWCSEGIITHWYFQLFSFQYS